MASVTSGGYMETGHFENGGTVYVISTPKTPLPWKNQLFSAGGGLEFVLIVDR